jgi:8-oxo-dGTP diphosphatase
MEQNTRRRRAPIAGVGAVISNAAGQVLLIRRGQPPRLGQWSIPGGKLEWGESVKEGLRREIREETGLVIEIERLVDIVDLLTRDAAGDVIGHYVLIDFKAVHVSGELRAGSDAAEARWVDPVTLDQYALWDETRRVIIAGLGKS